MRTAVLVCSEDRHGVVQVLRSLDDGFPGRTRLLSPPGIRAESDDGLPLWTATMAIATTWPRPVLHIIR